MPEVLSLILRENVSNFISLPFLGDEISCLCHGECKVFSVVLCSCSPLCLEKRRASHCETDLLRCGPSAFTRRLDFMLTNCPLCRNLRVSFWVHQKEEGPAFTSSSERMRFSSGPWPVPPTRLLEFHAAGEEQSVVLIHIALQRKPASVICAA